MSQPSQTYVKPRRYGKSETDKEEPWAEKPLMETKRESIFTVPSLDGAAQPCTPPTLLVKSREPPAPSSSPHGTQDTVFRIRAEKNGAPVRMFPVYFEDDGTLCFQDDDGLESDNWRSKWCSEPQIFRNVEHYILIAKLGRPENQTAVFEEMTDQDKDDESGIRFIIHSYEDTVPRAQSVALTTRKDNKTYCLRAEKQANGEMRVAFQESNIPERISGDTSGIIFFQIPFSEGDSKFFKFESTLQRGYFLAFERGEGNHTRRLIMKRVLTKDEVDETIKLCPSSN
uniref:interleukin-18-like n=1 Tax=Euleptes europaea TaxID=460621 RepID=UPI002540B75E|nr:interleukin-18-like [Euleptes europaea]